MEGIQCSCEEFPNEVKRQITIIIGKYLKMILENGNHYFMTTLATDQCDSIYGSAGVGYFHLTPRKLK